MNETTENEATDVIDEDEPPETETEAQKNVNKKKKLGNKKYLRELEELHVELVKLQQWVLHKGLKVCIVFEGRDGAGKGGTIKAITVRVSPRIFRGCGPASAHRA